MEGVHRGRRGEESQQQVSQLGEEARAVLATLMKPLILENIFSYVKKEKALKKLRLVCAAFNKAILTVGLSLNLNTLFNTFCEEYGGRESRWDGVLDKPLPLHVFQTLELNKEAVRNVDIGIHEFPRHKAKYKDGLVGQIPKIAVPAINVMKFCKIFGSEIWSLSLAGLSEDTFRPMALTFNRYCPNIRWIKISFTRCWCRQNFPEDNPPSLPLLPTTLTHLEHLRVECNGIECQFFPPFVASLVAGSARTLKSAYIHDNVFPDLSECREFRSLHYTVSPGMKEFECDVFKKRIGSGSRIEHLEIVLDGTSKEKAEAALQTSTSVNKLPYLRSLRMSVVGTWDFNYGPFLGHFISGKVTPELYSLQMESGGEQTNGDFFRLLPVHHHNGSLRRLVIRNLQGYRNEGFIGTNRFVHLQSAFPNLEVLQLPDDGIGERKGGGGGGQEGLRAVFHPLSLWTGLKEVCLKLNFKFSISDLSSMLEELDSELWSRGNLKRFTLKCPSFLIPPTETLEVGSSLKSTLLAMKGMEKVIFSEFEVPKGMGEELTRFIREHGLPVSFPSSSDNKDASEDEETEEEESSNSDTGSDDDDEY